jgi:tetratricopeptide (TPR) repeat protein
VNSLRSKLIARDQEPEQKALVEKEVAIAEEQFARASRLDRLSNDHVFRGVARKSLEFHWNQGKSYLDTAQLDKARDSFAKAAVEVNRLSSWPDAAKEFIALERTLGKTLEETLPRLREEERLLYSFLERRLKQAGETIESGDAHAARAMAVELETAIKKADEAVEVRRECLRVRRRVERLAGVPALAPSLEQGDRLVIAAAESAGAGKLDESLKTLRDARSHFEELHVRAQEETRKLLDHARTQKASGHYKQALAALRSALAIAPENEAVQRLHSQISIDVRVVTALDRGHAKLVEGDLRGAAESFSVALVLSPRLEPSPEKETVAKAFFDLAESYKTGTGVGLDLAQAVIWYDRAGLVFSVAGERERLATCLFLGATCLQKDANPQGSWPLAARAFERAALEYKALDMTREYVRSRDAQAHSTELAGDWNSAAGIHKELALLYGSAQNPGARADSLSRQAFCLEPSQNRRGSWKTASEIYKDAIRIYKKLGPEYRKAKRLAILRQHDCVEAMRGRR